jgi:predicted ArsR family transcriptional regulator
LAERLRVTENAVRSQLMILERDGLVRISGQRRGTRRPNYTYKLTQEAERLFPKAYASVLAEVFETMRQQLPPEAREQWLRETGARLAKPHLGELTDKPFAERADRVLKLLQTMGANAEVTEEENAIRLRGNGCPLSKVAHLPEGAEPCLIMRAMLEELLGVPVDEACTRSDSPQCCFVVHRPA